LAAAVFGVAGVVKDEHVKSIFGDE
jgi:hypothetical protein